MSSAPRCDQRDAAKSTPQKVPTPKEQRLHQRHRFNHQGLGKAMGRGPAWHLNAIIGEARQGTVLRCQEIQIAYGSAAPLGTGSRTAISVRRWAQMASVSCWAHMVFALGVAVFLWEPVGATTGRLTQSRLHGAKPSCRSISPEYGRPTTFGGCAAGPIGHRARRRQLLL